MLREIQMELDKLCSLVQNIVFFGLFKSLIQQTKITLVVCVRLTKKIDLSPKGQFCAWKTWKTTLTRRLVERGHFEVLQKN